MVFTKQSLYKWHIDRNVHPNEKIADKDKKPVGDFHCHNGKWILINRAIPDMSDVTNKNSHVPVPIGKSVELTEGKLILFGKDPGARLCMVQMVSN